MINPQHSRYIDPFASGKRFKYLLKILDQFKIRWGLTGSFTSNGLEDVFGQCKIVNMFLLGKAKGAFMQQYFLCLNRQYGQWMPIKGSLEKVMSKIKPSTYLLGSVAVALLFRCRKKRSLRQIAA